MNPSSTCLILFVRSPVLGKVKTRLAATIGEKQALMIYELLLKHTHDITASLTCTKYVYYADEVSPVDLWDEGNFIKTVQKGNNLGVRMQNAFHAAFDGGHQRVVIIGSDCYELDSEMIIRAFNFLNHNDAVIGPAEDGGYYLLGLAKSFPAIFEGKIWSTHSVCADTIKDLESKSMSYKLLPTLNDVDEAADLERSKIRLSDNPASPDRL
ncbi:TIGR04282 family arsenosugar biosynthesis glycosyltransferase [Daejeonella sp.]|uniref:TIGR04282 family arsenosugar biosynthesis glycosyltransferase n=1 Tax=Daejeonella sp. TaxID=2805397 RepID=UPI003983B121